VRRAALTATGRYFPQRVVPNSYFYDDLGLDTNEEWIRSRTGVTTRHFADVSLGETTSGMCVRAARQCLDRASVAAHQLDGIIVATITPDQALPSTACFVQEALGATGAWAFDLVAACSGYVYGLAHATAMVRSGLAHRVLVIGAETMTSILDFEDRNTCIIFGDGAGATLVEAASTGGLEIVDFRMHSAGDGAELLMVPAGGASHPASADTIAARMHYVKQDGRAVFKHAVTRISEVIMELLAGHGLGSDDVDLVVPHQANIRIIEACGRKVKVPMERIAVTVDRWANTTAATIPTTLDWCIEEGRVPPGGNIVLATFGAGFTWGSALLRA
jgi:3-oxoacyl-[acyl-carrier-protein] synthase-3